MKYMQLFETEQEYNEQRQNHYKEPWVSLTLSGDGGDNTNKIVINKGYYIFAGANVTVHWFDGDYIYNPFLSSQNSSAYTNSNNVTITYPAWGDAPFLDAPNFTIRFTGYSLNDITLTITGGVQTYGTKVDSSTELVHTYDGTYYLNSETGKYEKDGYALDFDSNSGFYDEELNLIFICQNDRNDDNILYVIGAIASLLNNDYVGTYTYDHYDSEEYHSAFTKDNITLYANSFRGNITDAYINTLDDGEGYVEGWYAIKPQYATEIVTLNRVDYNKTERDRLLEVPLTFEITSDGSIYWVYHEEEGPGPKGGNTKSIIPVSSATIEYKLNNGEWTEITSATGSSAPSISVVAGDTVQFRGNNQGYTINVFKYNHFATIGSTFRIKGNIMSLINSTDFATLTTLQSISTFYRLFDHCTGLTDASNLILPASVLASNCYSQMFSYCTSLVNVPELPATTLAGYCYDSMFYACTSLVTAPVLPATTLAGYCYNNMFSYCTSLVTAPELPATTLAVHCYQYMFSNCTKLNYIKCLATDISAANCTYNWVQGIANYGTFVIPGCGIGWRRDNNSSIPQNWDVFDLNGNNINDCYPSIV